MHACMHDTSGGERERLSRSRLHALCNPWGAPFLGRRNVGIPAFLIVRHHQIRRKYRATFLSGRRDATTLLPTRSSKRKAWDRNLHVPPQEVCDPWEARNGWGRTFPSLGGAKRETTSTGGAVGGALMLLLPEVEAHGSEAAAATMAEREKGRSRAGIFRSVAAAEYAKADDRVSGDEMFV